MTPTTINDVIKHLEEIKKNLGGDVPVVYQSLHRTWPLDITVKQGLDAPYVLVNP